MYRDMVPQQWDVLISTTLYNELYHLYRSPQADHRTAKLEVQMLHLGDGTWSSGIRVALSPWIFQVWDYGHWLQHFEDLRSWKRQIQLRLLALTCTICTVCTICTTSWQLSASFQKRDIPTRESREWIVWWSAQAPLPSVALEGSKSDGSH